MTLTHAIAVAQEELEYAGRSGRKVVGVRPDPESALSMIVSYENGEEGKWTGLLAVRLKHALALVENPEPLHIPRQDGLDRGSPAAPSETAAQPEVSP